MRLGYGDRATKAESKQPGFMAIVTHPKKAYSPSLYPRVTNWLNSYRQFTAKAEFYRIPLSGTALILQGCLLSPALLLTMFYFGGGDWQMLVSNLGFLLILVPFCSALPVRYILPAFVISFVVHLTVILTNVL